MGRGQDAIREDATHMRFGQTTVRMLRQPTPPIEINGCDLRRGRPTYKNLCVSVATLKACCVSDTIRRRIKGPRLGMLIESQQGPAAREGYSWITPAFEPYDNGTLCESL